MSVDDKTGGYSVEWFVKAPSEHFKCGICFDVLKNPHQCKNGHTFCHSCISIALEQHLECPTCKTALSPDTLSLALSLRNLIDELLVNCCQDAGCEWTGTLEQSAKHFQLCSMRSVPCPLYAHHVCTDKNCTGRIKRKDVDKHVSGGSKRDVADAMLIMAETIAYQKKEIEMLHNLCLNSEAGIHTLDDESTFVGILKDGEMEGFGFLKHSDGVTYSGHFTKGAYSRFGVLREIVGILTGEWENGNVNGHCMVRIPESETPGDTLQNCASMVTYIGDFRNDNMHGFGRIIGSVGTVVGSFENGEICTALPSTMAAPDGSVFVGIIDSNCHFIKGKFTTSGGVVYEGTFCKNANEFRVNGTGTITYTDGSIYTGEFRSGLKHGKGSLVGRNGSIYTGEFRRGLRCDGKGSFSENNGVLSASAGGFWVWLTNLLTYKSAN